MRPIRHLLSIFLIVAILGGCSLVRTGYQQADHLGYWWIDRQLDLTSEQSRWLKAELKLLHAWHRRTQLPAYADLLAAIARRSRGDVSPSEVCADIDSASARLDTLLLQSVPVWAQLARQLSPQQLQQLRRKFDDEDRKWRQKWLEVDQKTLFRQRHEEWTDRAESFYGRLDDVQKTYIRDAIRRSPWDAQLSWQRRQLRQQQTIAVLDKIAAQHLSLPAAEDEIRALIQRVMQPEDARMLSMQHTLVGEACANLSGLHQLASPAQRLRAQDKLLAYAQDFRVLAVQR